MALLISSSSNNVITGSKPAPTSERNSQQLRDVSFSSYLNSSEEECIRTLAQSSLINFRMQPKNPEGRGGDIDVFGAKGKLTPQPQERYSKGRSTLPKIHQSPSCQSESSWNSQIGLLIRKNRNNMIMRKAVGIRNLLFRCYSCDDTSSVVIHEPADGHNIDINKDNFVFPVPEETVVAANSDNMISWPWDHVIPAQDHHDDNRLSEASSDLFELESIQLEAYAASEASIDWSVATADFEEQDHTRTRSTSHKKSKFRALLGCITHKAVRLCPLIQN